MSAPAAPMTRSSTEEEQDRTDEWVSLAVLLNLGGASAGPPAGPGRPSPAHRALGRPGLRLRERLRGWVRRATYWGAGPQGAWCAW